MCKRKISKEILLELKGLPFPLLKRILEVKVEEDEILDMESFIKFCKSNDLAGMIQPTIIHDLINFCKKENFLPRTIGYDLVWKQLKKEESC